MTRPRLAPLLVLLSGCAPLAPYQRTDLMTRVMQDTPAPLEAGIDVHVQQTREAMAGAGAVGGKSCGCN
jgi:hypothetical protein